MKFWKSIDPWSGVVIVLTATLFGLSLVVNGFTHDLFLESGVFLVSVKLILMTGKHAASEERLETHLRRIKEILESRIRTSTEEGTAPRQADPFKNSAQEREEP